MPKSLDRNFAKQLLICLLLGLLALAAAEWLPPAPPGHRSYVEDNP